MLQASQSGAPSAEAEFKKISNYIANDMKQLMKPFIQVSVDFPTAHQWQKFTTVVTRLHLLRTHIANSGQAAASPCQKKSAGAETEPKARAKRGFGNAEPPWEDREFELR
jgi:hypothetical protein